MRNKQPPEPARSGQISGHGLRLRGEDAEDLAVISACLQDALVSLRDLAYDRAARTFLFVANRFRWEGGAPYERTLCGVAFDEIDGVAYRGFHRGEEDRILALLAIQPIPPNSGQPAGEIGVTIDLEFAGGATIRLSAAKIQCRARDLGEPWPTVWHPEHSLDPPP